MLCTWYVFLCWLKTSAVCLSSAAVRALLNETLHAYFVFQYRTMYDVTSVWMTDLFFLIPDTFSDVLCSIG